MKHTPWIKPTLIASCSLILGLAIGYILWSSTPPVKVVINEEPTTSAETTDSDFETNGCTWFDCLFTSDDGTITTGYTTIKGYYSQFETKDRNGDSVTCDAFVMTEGSEELIDGFWHTDNKVSAFGIYPSILSTEITKSTIEDPIEVNVVAQYNVTGKGADSCYSHVRIVGMQ
jgi:hypothetical protein